MAEQIHLNRYTYTTNLGDVFISVNSGIINVELDSRGESIHPIDQLTMLAEALEQVYSVNEAKIDPVLVEVVNQELSGNKTNISIRVGDFGTAETIHTISNDGSTYTYECKINSEFTDEDIRFMFTTACYKISAILIRGMLSIVNNNNNNSMP